MSDNERDIFEEAEDDLFGDPAQNGSLNESSIVEGADAPEEPHLVISQPELTEVKEEKKRPTSSSHEDENVMYIQVSDPEKIGDGMGAFIVYRINTKTTLSVFRKPELSVRRRFSDFLGLHEKLVSKHLTSGFFIPAPPEKSVLSLTKIKMSKEDSSGEFVEHRRAALERFLIRISKHPRLRIDPDFREFLEFDGDLPKSSGTQALSGASVIRLFKNVGDAVGKITYKMDEVDSWFEDKQMEVENLEKQLIRLHQNFESLVTNRKELAGHTQCLARASSVLANVEEHTGLARALSQLAETEERLEQIHSDQAESDFYTLSETVKDYISLIVVVKATFHERVKLYKSWKDAELSLTKKREQKVKLELANKNDKIGMIEQEIIECERRVERGKQDFERISTSIKQELITFDKQRVTDFKKSVIKCLERMVANQEKVIQYWDAYLPEAKAIS